jgi:hypothetical protein
MEKFEACSLCASQMPLCVTQQIFLSTYTAWDAQARVRCFLAFGDLYGLVFGPGPRPDHSIPLE